MLLSDCSSCPELFIFCRMLHNYSRQLITPVAWGILRLRFLHICLFSLSSATVNEAGLIRVTQDQRCLLVNILPASTCHSYFEPSEGFTVLVRLFFLEMLKDFKDEEGRMILINCIQGRKKHFHKFGNRISSNAPACSFLLLEAY